MAGPDASSQRRFSRPALPIRRSPRHREVAAELFCEIDRYTGVHTALSVQELGMVIERHDRPMPNAWMNIKPAAAVTPERNELLRCHVVPRHERPALRPVAQMEPSAAAEMHGARPPGSFDPCGGVDSIAPDVELKLCLAHDPGRERPMIDPDPH